MNASYTCGIFLTTSSNIQPEKDRKEIDQNVKRVHFFSNFLDELILHYMRGKKKKKLEQIQARKKIKTKILYL